MAGDDRGPLIATFDDGTQIFRNGVLNSRGYFEVNIGIFNFGAEFNPNTGEWTGNETASFVSGWGAGSIELSPSDDGLALEFSGSLGIVDIGIVITEDGDVLPMLGLGVGNDILGIGIGYVIADDGDNLSSYNTITVSPGGLVIKTEHFPGDSQYPHVKVKITIFDADGNITYEGFTSIADQQRAADMAAGIADRGVEQCFAAGTMISMWDGSKKPIEEIVPDDMVVSFDQRTGERKPGRVTRTMRNEVRIVLSFFGMTVTPGHMFYCSGGRFAGGFATLIDILRDDGAIQLEDGRNIRACTGVPIDDPRDALVQVVAGDFLPGGRIGISASGNIRAGTRIILDDGRDISLFDVVQAGGGTILDDGLIATPDCPEGMPFHWTFSADLPNPEDYVLRLSNTSVEEIYRANEWHDGRPGMQPPWAQDGGPGRPGSPHAVELMSRNEPMTLSNAATLDATAPRRAVKPKAR